MKNLKKYLSIILATLVFSMAFTGCMLSNPNSVKKDIQRLLPGCEITDVEETEKCNTYTVKYKDIEFHVYNEIKKTSIDNPIESPQFSTDYFAKILETDKAKSLLAKYNMTIGTSYNNSSPVIDGIAENTARLREIYDFIDEFNDYVYEYLPEQKFYNAEFMIESHHTYNEFDNRIELEKIGVREEIDWDYRYLCVLSDIKSKTESTSTDDEIKYTFSPDYFTDVDYDSIPHRYIRNLYINGKEFTSEKYDIKFVYRVEDGNYYAITGYGQRFENNFGVEDHIHREIITSYYPDSDYTIRSKSQITTYEINGNKYKMTSTRENEQTEFYKNNEPLNIETLREIDGHTTNTTYFVFIKADDWAKLMEMNVNKIDKSGVYLSTY